MTTTLTSPSPQPTPSSFSYCLPLNTVVLSGEPAEFGGPGATRFAHQADIPDQATSAINAINEISLDPRLSGSCGRCSYLSEQIDRTLYKHRCFLCIAQGISVADHLLTMKMNWQNWIDECGCDGLRLIFDSKEKIVLQ